jgi:uncharacterized protein involved in exopolysaccharide biosynthesis
MNQPNPSAAPLRDVLRLLRTYPLRWLLPTIAIAAAVALYAKTRPTTWEASQALMVRDEAAGTDHLGKFHLVDDMKTVQETILELAKGRSVIAAALRNVGPPAGRTPQTGWPADQDVAALQGAMKLSPPKGAEFGKTEVFYLQVQSSDRQRAIALAAALSDQLKRRFEDLRDARAESVIDELSRTVNLSEADLKAATEKLARMDAAAGPDLGELRTMLDTPAGDSPLRRSLIEMQTELRGAQTSLDANRELLDLLVASKADAHALLAAPSRLLESQPVLKRLKDGLVDAQIHTAQLMSTMSASHPSVLAAKDAETEIANHLTAELDAAIRGVEGEVQLSSARTAAIEQQLTAARERLDRLAKVRADYANLVAEVRRRSDTLRSVENQLAEARASQAASHTASLLSRVDSPDTGANPIGLGRSTIVVAGCVGGFLVGLGLLFLTVPPTVRQDDVVDIAPRLVRAWAATSLAPAVDKSAMGSSAAAAPFMSKPAADSSMHDMSSVDMPNVPMPPATLPVAALATMPLPADRAPVGEKAGARTPAETSSSPHAGSLTFKQALAKLGQGQRQSC